MRDRSLPSCLKFVRTTAVDRFTQLTTARRKRSSLGNRLVLAAILLPSTAAAIVTRHDVPDEAYVQKAADLPSYCRMRAPDGGGALIAPHWVITAAHLTPDFEVGHRFSCGVEELEVAEIIVHPQYDEKVGRHDLALIRLQRASKQAPLKLWRGNGETGQIISLIGHWTGGNGLLGVSAEAAKTLKGATNRVASADEHWLRFSMDPPSDIASTPLEGVSGGGDSGAPAYLTQAGSTYLLGVGSRNLDTNADGIEQNYGDTDLYVRVSSYAPWIDRVLAGQETAFSRAMMRHGYVLPWVLAVAALAGLALLVRRTRRRHSRFSR
jgi:hypothetical protein